MTKRKIEPALQVAGAIHNATDVLSRRITALGGNYTEAFVCIGMGEKQYNAEINQLASIYAGISIGLIAVPEGGRIHVLRDVVVDESIDWNAAIDASCPDTPVNFNVLKVGDNYPAKKNAKPDPCTIVLVNFGKDVLGTDLALAWGKDNKLPIASPRAVFAAVRKNPTLYKELGVDPPMVVISLEECLFSSDRCVPYVCLDGDERRADLNWPDNRLYAFCWFAFVRELLLAA